MLGVLDIYVGAIYFYLYLLFTSVPWYLVFSLNR